MTSYRCYFFDAKNKIASVENADQPDDEAARRWGEALLQRDPVTRAVEVWQLARQICRYEKPRS
jgi:hypothetical protein